MIRKYRKAKRIDLPYKPSPIVQKEEVVIPKRILRKHPIKPKFYDIDEDFEIFQLELAELNLKMKIMQGDGNCLFRSICDQIEGTEKNHKKYRKLIVIASLINSWNT